MANVEKGGKALDDSAAGRPKALGPKSFGREVRELWEKGLPPGFKTGWPSVDKHYTVAPGQFTVITGWPGAGKSEWLDALLVNLSRQGWKVALFSPENAPTQMHISKLMEKIAGKPFGAGRTERISFDEIDEIEDELEQSFSFLSCPDGGTSAAGVIGASEPWLAQFPDCPKGIVIDPWNELEHWRSPGLSETEYISMTLSLLRNWARTKNVHVWIVAHPQKMRREDNGKLPVPKPDMISGSAHWWNKSDNAITVYRDLNDHESRIVDIHVQKIRFKNIGYPGVVSLTYDRVTGRYFEPRQSALYAVAKDGE